MKKRTQILLFLIAILLNACNAQTKQEQRLADFKKQKHRFEFNKCDMYYNGKKIELYKPKKYYANIFGDNFDEKNPNFHKKVPISLNIIPRSINQLNIRDAIEIRIRFKKPNKDYKFYKEFKHLPTFKKGEYILIDGIPFGHNVPFEELNQALTKQGSLPFSNKFAGSYNIKARRFTNCENYPLFSFMYSKRTKKLNDFAYEIRKPKNLN